MKKSTITKLKQVAKTYAPSIIGAIASATAAVTICTVSNNIQKKKEEQLKSNAYDRGFGFGVSAASMDWCNFVKNGQYNSENADQAFDELIDVHLKKLITKENYEAVKRGIANETGFRAEV